MENAEGPRNIDDVLADVAESPELAEFKDASPRRQKLYQLIADSPDPLWREIGQQLRDGHMRPSEVLSTPLYREQLQAGMADGLERFTQMVGAIEDHVRADAVGQTSAGEVAGGGVDTDSADDLSETMGPILRRR